ncbi:MerR family transcriptional regulator [Pontivivens nitratireducens]|jgi:DNA-binding transcriptional MerR regulator|uniref:Helix-turn-helix domain-containing protein n=1 Tax=Pontivivens nitratireducens TaxID=2758038 RepID=A0A6G7VQG2_9RHOB|nr:helix-turn-helix domain-containing protein [Pontibrevibacter nitratireducens]QIK42160.1 helix-turn-helix domain-containing protein [Pontibrevibacter nitratireducens]|tara:strand:- start:954 stop:1370 length:417 start_codon:yes stop_codon:yes gene_type:complete
MFSIGELSKRAKVKIPTIRYYEEVGLLAAPERTEGNQRRYDASGLERLSFIKHARDLGFSIEAISQLIELQGHPDRSCQVAKEIVVSQLSNVRAKIKRLRALEKELVRISKGCDGEGVSEECYVLASLADHLLCRYEH